MHAPQYILNALLECIKLLTPFSIIIPKALLEYQSDLA